MPEEELERIVREVDIAGNGIINYHEFIAATFPVEKYATQERLHSLFQKFDTDGSHHITGSSLRDAFTKLGHNMTTAEIDEIMNEHDVDHHHEITYEEFKDMILNHM